MKRQFPIERGIPVPPPRKHGNWPKTGVTYPFASMEVGDSFFIPRRTSNRIAAAWATTRRVTGFRFTARRAVKAGVMGTRVWRIG